MAYTSTHAPAPSGALARIGDVLLGFLKSVGMAMMVNSTGAARVQKVRDLEALSDAQLAELGIPRDQIVRHVFRDVYYV